MKRILLAAGTCLALTQPALIADDPELAVVLTPGKSTEVPESVAAYLLSKISGSYTEEQLRGMSPAGIPIEASDNFWYEVEFPRPGDGRPSDRRRFTPSSAPYFDSAGLQWRIQLRRQRDDRAQNGDMSPSPGDP